MSLFRRGEIWWYEFWFAGRHIAGLKHFYAQCLRRPRCDLFQMVTANFQKVIGQTAILCCTVGNRSALELWHST